MAYNEKVLEFIDKVSKIDLDAAKYLLSSEWLSQENVDKYVFDGFNLRNLFIWAETPQGHDYWSTIHNKLLAQEENY